MFPTSFAATPPGAIDLTGEAVRRRRTLQRAAMDALEHAGYEELLPPTFEYEDKLPRVPLPTLEESCALFLEWFAPLLAADELAETETAVTEFLASETVRALQADLVRYNDSPGVRSWLDTFWPYRYLGRRDYKAKRDHSVWEVATTTKELASGK